MDDGNLPDSLPDGAVTSEKNEDETDSMASSGSQPLPLRLYSINVGQWDDPKAVNRHCSHCGEVGNLACFSASFRKWALRRATEEELKQHCNRCGEFGHNCLSCYIPITYKWKRFSNSRPTPAAPMDKIKSPGKPRKPPHCSRCGEAGHNRRTCCVLI